MWSVYVMKQSHFSAWKCHLCLCMYIFTCFSSVFASDSRDRRQGHGRRHSSSSDSDSSMEGGEKGLKKARVSGRGESQSGRRRQRCKDYDGT